MFVSNALVVAALATTPVLVQDLAPEARPSALEARVKEIAARSRGAVGVAAIGIESGQRFGVGADRRYPMQSTFKTAVALAVLHRVDQGQLKLDQRIKIERSDLRPGVNEHFIESWKPGLTLSIAGLLDMMMTESDNTATDTLLRVIGGPPAVSARIAEMNVEGIDVSRTELELGNDACGAHVVPNPKLTPEEITRRWRSVPRATRQKARARFERDSRDTATPDAMATLLVRLYKGELLSKGNTEHLLGLMRRNKTGDSRLRAMLPKGTEVFDKTGTGARSTNDVGIVTLPDGSHLAIAVFVMSSPEPTEVCARSQKAATSARTRWPGSCVGAFDPERKEPLLMRMPVCVLSLAILTSACASAPPRASRVTAFVGVNVVPMDGDHVLNDQTVIQGDVVTALGSRASVAVPKDTSAP